MPQLQGSPHKPGHALVLLLQPWWPLSSLGPGCQSWGQAVRWVLTAPHLGGITVPLWNRFCVSKTTMRAEAALWKAGGLNSGPFCLRCGADNLPSLRGSFSTHKPGRRVLGTTRKTGAAIQQVLGQTQRQLDVRVTPTGLAERRDHVVLGLGLKSLLQTSGPLLPPGKPQTDMEPFQRPSPPGHVLHLTVSLQQPWSLFSHQT